MPTYAQFKLPDVGEGLTEAEVLRWFVAVGDHVVVNQTIVEIETAKAAVELPCPYDGVVTELLVLAGTTVDVGTPIITIDTDAEGSPTNIVGLTETVAEREAVLVGYGVLSSSSARRPRHPAGGAMMPVQPTRHGGLEIGRAVEHALADAPAPAAPPVRAKPPVRKRAKDLGVDLASVRGSGPDGIVTRADVDAHLSGAAPGAEWPDAERLDAERREPVKGIRKHMAEAMVRSAFTVPHVTEWVTVDVTRSAKLVKRLRETPGFTGVKVSPLLLVARAVLSAAEQTPEVNAFFDDEAQEVAYQSRMNLGIAAATPRGLVVPNIKDAGALSLPELAVALESLVETAKAGRTTPADMAGGTFTITNVGVFGIDGGTPIINPGESAILAMGAFRERPWVHHGRVRVRIVAELSLSFDHRFIDGALGSRFLAGVAAILEDPALAAARA